MRLTEIRLAGFKSFVEPVSLKLEHNLTCVVGPNGCGKSNIIDALTWVMGESSARHLRGESLADVIFHGGGQQPQAGRAQVELLFDNEVGRIGGRLADYREISIRRTLDRDGESTYFLNSTPCRRKDILSLFRGTGLGPRSYSVIEQGTISRLVEARPEELRAHLEEAAGVSRYREARRETANRIRRTRENLARINDIRQEVGERIKALDRQSRQAERFRKLSSKRDRLNAELLALEWRELESLRVQQQEVQTKLAHDLDVRRTQLTGLGDELKREREELESLDRDCETLQRECYEADAGIKQLEQSIAHTVERITTMERALEQGHSDTVREQEQLGAERRAAKELEERHAVLRARGAELELASKQAAERLYQAEQASRACVTEWEQRTQEHAEVERRLEALNVRMRHLHERLRDLEHQNGARTEELQALDPSLADQELAQRQNELHQTEQRRIELEQNERQSGVRLTELHAAITEAQRDLDSSRLAHQELHAGLSSLQALQREALGREPGEEMRAWLMAHGFAESARLGERIRIKPRWRRSVELALGAQLRALQVEHLEAAAQGLDTLPVGEFGAYCDDEDSEDAALAAPGSLPTLLAAADVSGLPAELLAGVYAAETLDQAMSARTHLGPGECIAVPEGVLIGRNWLRAASSGAERGILQRASGIESLATRHAESEKRCRELEQSLGTLHAQVEQQQAVHEDFRHRLKEQHEQWSERRSSLAVGMEQLEQRQARATRLKEELKQINDEKTTVAEELRQVAMDRERLISAQQETSATQARLQQSRRKLESELDIVRTAWQQAKDEHHASALELEKAASRRTSLLESAATRERTLEQLQVRRSKVQQEQAQTGEPLPRMRTQCATAVRERARLQEKFDVQQERRQQHHDAWDTRDQQRAAMESALRTHEQTLHEHELKVREHEVRRDTVAEQLTEAGLVAERLLVELGEDATADEHRLHLEKVQTAIERIGAINLGAVEERQELAERSRYLDEQNTDLEQSLATLEKAIQRIDRESRRRFTETLEKVDAHLGELFPALFGGGSAHLVLDSDNPLSGGLRFMARPPGKRNTSIHLLSGGEKALSALALVFAIFHLNPAPLCVLDEVDAPLDDNNVGRYCQLVRDMAKQVQFIIITHNKLSMEMANTLLGVTMQEAGVSRFVSVNVEEAVELAASA